MVIYRLTDRIPAKIADLTFWLSPLSFEQKVNLMECKKMEGGVEVVDGLKKARLAIKYGIKGVDGLTNADGSKYEPAMDSDGTLAWSAVDEISELSCLSPVIHACLSLMGRFNEIKLEGVEFDLKGVKNVQKKD